MIGDTLAIFESQFDRRTKKLNWDIKLFVTDLSEDTSWDDIRQRVENLGLGKRNYLVDMGFIPGDCPKIVLETWEKGEGRRMTYTELVAATPEVDKKYEQEKLLKLVVDAVKRCDASTLQNIAQTLGIRQK